MAKKSFINAENPAMQFISAGDEKSGAASPAAPVQAEKGTDVILIEKETIPPRSAAKEPRPRKEKEESFYIPPRSPEHKSKRAQLLMTPSLHDRVAKKAASLNMSFNELVNIVLEKYVK